MTLALAGHVLRLTLWALCAVLGALMLLAWMGGGV